MTPTDDSRELGDEPLYPCQCDACACGTLLPVGVTGICQPCLDGEHLDEEPEHPEGR